MRVLAVGAHPDDLEIHCGGTLARFAQEGHSVVMCHVASGDKGSSVLPAQQLARVRADEARRATLAVGATHATLGVPDGEISASDPEQRRAMIDLVRVVRPDVAITHSTDDYLADHDETSRLVFDATFAATLPLLETDQPPHGFVAPLYWMETSRGLGFNPSEFVDVSPVIDTKVAMLEAHESQLRWLRDHDGIDIVEQMRTAARFRGYQCGVEYAEGFIPCVRALRATTRRLLP
jgi:LmbE family N-acetylglucosaminyl deacetylase